MCVACVIALAVFIYTYYIHTSIVLRSNVLVYSDELYSWLCAMCVRNLAYIVIDFCDRQ